MLKPERAVYVDEIINVAPSAVEAGQILVYGTQGTGHAVGAGLNEAAPQVVPVGTGNPASGTRIAGVALQDVVDIYSHALLADGSDASGFVSLGIGDPINMRYFHRNTHKTEQVVGEAVCLLKDGWIYTDRITGTPTAGDPAYLGPNSNFQTTQVNSLPQVGKFDTSKDSDGYAKISVKIV